MPRTVNKRSLAAAAAAGIVMLGAGISACNRTESTASLLAEAKQYQQKGDNKAALIQLRNAVSKSPEDAEARLQLGTLYETTGDMLSAEKEIRKAIGLDMRADRTLPVLSRSLLAQGQFQKVLDEVKPELAKNSAPLLTLRGDAYLGLNDLPKAKQAYEQALALQAGAAGALIGLARYSTIRQDADGANRYLAQALAQDPKNPDVWMFKGALLRAQGKPEEALVAYDQALLLKPDHRSAHIEKAYLEISLGKFDAAKADIDAARKDGSGGLIVSYTQALLDFTQGKNALALESLQKVLRSAPEHMPSILLAGAVELNLGSTQQAEQHLKKYVEAFPTNVYARKLLAQALLKSSQPTDAAAALAPALKEPSEDPQLLALAGQSYLQVKDFNKATGYFEQASALAPQAAALHTSLGLSKLGQGDQATAISELELGASLEAKSPNAGMALVLTELSLKHYDKALAAVQTLEKQQPDNPQVQNLKGGVYLSKADPANARASFEKALALQANFFPAVSNLARLDLQEQKPEAAKKRYEAVLEKDKKHIGALTALADIANAQGHPEQATTWLEKASSDNPRAIAPAVRLAAHYLQNQQEQKALTLMRKLQTADPTNPDLLDLMGQIQIANKDPGSALETFSKLVNVLPKSPLAQMRLAGVHMMMKNDDLAAQDLKRAIALDPNFLQAHTAQAELAMRTGNPAEAMAIARQIQQRHDNPAVGHALEGDLQLTQNKPALALASYEKAFRAVNTPALLIKIAEVMKRMGKSGDAEARLATWQRDHPAEPLVAMYMAESHLANKQYKPAIALLQVILKHKPNQAIALNNLAWAYQQEKDPRAVETAEQALKLAPDSAAVMDTLGWVLVEQGNTARGLPLLQKAVTLAPEAPDVRYHLAVGLSKSGDRINARKQIDKLLSDNKPFPQIEEARAMLKVL